MAKGPRHHQLKDRDWLYYKYHVQKLKQDEIAAITGCALISVNRAFKFHKIPTRVSVSGRGVPRTVSYKDLENYNLLYDLYVNQKLTMEEIAKRLNVNRSAVCSHLHKHQIERRKLGERGFTPPLSINHSVLEGGLLGDGYLRPRKYVTSYVRGNLHYSHVSHIANYFYEDKQYTDDRIKTVYQKPNNTRIYRWSSYGHRELNSYRHRWYPESNNYIKLVPRDIVIDEILLREWFCDDGCTAKTGAYFCSQGFSRDDNEFLCDKVNAFYDFGLHLAKTHGGSGVCIRLPAPKMLEFFDMIGPPLPCFQYKWKYGMYAIL